MSGHRLLYVDAGAGAAGDMLLGAFVDLGVPLERLRERLEPLAPGAFTLKHGAVRRAGFAACKVDVVLRETSGPARGMAEIERLVRGADLGPAVEQRALAVFRRLVEAEAEAHGLPPERVHLHEAGGLDAIVDVVGAVVALEHLGDPRVVVSPLTLGHGSVHCQHGELPVPAPATLSLVRGFPVRGGEVGAERLTPTGAAILTTLADDWGPLPPCRPLATGTGAGSRDLEGIANCVRLILAEPLDEIASDPPERVSVLQCTLDDATPQTLAYTVERLLEAGALDAYTTPATMKKGRPGHQLTVLSPVATVAALCDIVLEETTTLGLRVREERRVVLERRWERVATPWGEVRVKLGHEGNRVRNAWPEYDDCAALARRAGVPLIEVQRAALRALADTEAFDRSDPPKRPEATGARTASRTRRPTDGRRAPDPTH